MTKPNLECMYVKNDDAARSSPGQRNVGQYARQSECCRDITLGLHLEPKSPFECEQIATIQ